MQKCDWRGRAAHSGSKKRLPCLRCRKENFFATPLRRECHFCEKTHRSRAADGVAHRILENVTFERRESRATPPPRAAISGRLSSRSWVKMTVVYTQTPSNYITIFLKFLEICKNKFYNSFIIVLYMFFIVL